MSTADELQANLVAALQAQRNAEVRATAAEKKIAAMDSRAAALDNMNAQLVASRDRAQSEAVGLAQQLKELTTKHTEVTQSHREYRDGVLAAAAAAQARIAALEASLAASVPLEKAQETERALQAATTSGRQAERDLALAQQLNTTLKAQVEDARQAQAAAAAASQSAAADPALLASATAELERTRAELADSREQCRLLGAAGERARKPAGFDAAPAPHSAPHSADAATQARIAALEAAAEAARAVHEAEVAVLNRKLGEAVAMAAEASARMDGLRTDAAAASAAHGRQVADLEAQRREYEAALKDLGVLVGTAGGGTGSGTGSGSGSGVSALAVHSVEGSGIGALAMARAEAAGLAAANAELRGQLERQESRIKSVSADCGARVDALAGAHAQSRARTDGSAAHLEALVASLQGERGGLEAALGSLRVELAHARASSSAASRAHEQLLLASINGGGGGDTELIDALRLRIGELESENGRLCDNAVTLEAALQQSREEVGMVTAKFEASAKTLLAEQREFREEVSAAAARYRQRIDALRVANENLHADVRRAEEAAAVMARGRPEAVAESVAVEMSLSGIGASVARDQEAAALRAQLVAEQERRLSSATMFERRISGLEGLLRQISAQIGGGGSPAVSMALSGEASPTRSNIHSARQHVARIQDELSGSPSASRVHGDTGPRAESPEAERHAVGPMAPLGDEEGGEPFAREPFFSQPLTSTPPAAAAPASPAAPSASAAAVPAVVPAAAAAVSPPASPLRQMIVVEDSEDDEF